MKRKLLKNIMKKKLIILLGATFIIGFAIIMVATDLIYDVAFNAYEQYALERSVSLSEYLESNTK